MSPKLLDFQIPSDDKKTKRRGGWVGGGGGYKAITIIDEDARKCHFYSFLKVLLSLTIAGSSWCLLCKGFCWLVQRTSHS